MSQQLFLIPGSPDPTTGLFVPKYTQAAEPLFGAQIYVIPYGSGLSFVLCDPNFVVDLSQASDVLVFPADLTKQLQDTDVTNIAAFFDANNIPSSFLTTSLTWSQVATTVIEIFLVTRVAKIDLFASPGLTKQAQPQTGLAATLSNDPTTQDSLLAAATQIGFDISGIMGSMTLGDALIALGSQVLEVS